MKIATWNIRGFNKPLKQNEVKTLIQKHTIDICGLLETKLNANRLDFVMRSKFAEFNQVNNFHLHGCGRMLVLWNPSKVDLQILDISSQMIH